MGDTYFKHKSLNKCTRVDRNQYWMEAIGVIGLVLVKRDMLQLIREKLRER